MPTVCRIALYIWPPRESTANVHAKTFFSRRACGNGGTIRADLTRNMALGFCGQEDIGRAVICDFSNEVGVGNSVAESLGPSGNRHSGTLPGPEMVGLA
jgi:hypothetical protein